MGLFDTVVVDCPWCNKQQYIQTKAGACLMESYDFFDDNAPLNVVESVSNFPEICSDCGKYFKPVLIVREVERDIIKCDEEGNDLTDAEEN